MSILLDVSRNQLGVNRFDYEFIQNIILAVKMAFGMIPLVSGRNWLEVLPLYPTGDKNSRFA